MCSSVEEAKLEVHDGHHLAYKKRVGDPSQPGIIFCSGFMSSLNGDKAVFLDEYAKKNNLSYVRFDYIGRELSSGTMDDFTVSTWKQNTIDVLDQLTEGPQILIGSSMGGWMAMLAAIERPERMRSIITIANAVDSMIQRYDNPAMKPRVDNEYKLGDKYSHGSPFWLERLEDARKNSVFSLGDIPIHCPVRLLHGMADDTIPYINSVNVAEKLMSGDVMVHLVKKADHRFSSEGNLAMLSRILDKLLKGS